MPIDVYYLDDEEMLCELFCDYFESAQIKITTFVDPQKAIKACKSRPPNLMFIDYRLPGTTGDQVATNIDVSIPKFLVTGDLTCKPSYEFLKIISKPYKFDEIQELINEFL